jgi:hypothetical protein
MTIDAVAYDDDPHVPRTSCPSAAASPVLAVVLGVQLLFILVLAAAGTGVPTAAVFAVGLLAVDLVIMSTKLPSLQAFLPWLLRSLPAAAWTTPKAG